MEHALTICTQADAIHKRIREAVKKKQLQKKSRALLQADALRLGIISASDVDLMKRAEAARQAVVDVDSFDLDVYANRGLEPSAPMGIRQQEETPETAERPEPEKPSQKEASQETHEPEDEAQPKGALPTEPAHEEAPAEQDGDAA